MDWDENEGGRAYRVVRNHEEQYSIWPDDLPIPAGWRETGVSGPRADCLAHIEQVWTDMRPLSLRQRMEQAAEGRDEP